MRSPSLVFAPFWDAISLNFRQALPFIGVQVIFKNHNRDGQRNFLGKMSVKPFAQLRSPSL